MSKPPPLILLVEDEPDIRSIFTESIEEDGYRIAVASNYADGLIMLNNASPALLIANVLLPDGDGHKLALLARRLGVPSLLATGHAEMVMKTEADGIPILAKPFKLSELQRVIRMMVDEAPPEIDEAV